MAPALGPRLIRAIGASFEPGVFHDKGAYITGSRRLAFPQVFTAYPPTIITTFLLGEKPFTLVTIPIMKFATLTALLAAPLVSLAAALPVERDVYAPPVTYPSNGTVWKPFEKHNVTW